MQRAKSIGRWGALALAGAAALGGCKKPPPAFVEPTHVDAQRAAWSLAPAGATWGVVAGSPAHLLDKLAALRAAAETGPASHQAIADLIAHHPEWPLDEKGWLAAGLDPTRPAGLFLSHARPLWLVGASDAARAQATLRALSDEPTLTCAPAGALLACSPGGTVAPAASPAASLWPKLERDATLVERGQDLVFYAPAEQLDASWGALADGARGLFGGLTFTPEEILVRVRGAHTKAATLRPYVTPQLGDRSLLGAATGARAVTRLLVAPAALWGYARTTVGPESFAASTGMVQAATGIDLDKDVIQNLTGEVVLATYQEGHTVALLGVRDDAVARRLMTALDRVAAGALAAGRSQLAELGLDITRAELPVAGQPGWAWTVGGRLWTELGRKQPGRWIVGTVPGAILVADDEAGVTALLARRGRSPSRFLDALPTRAARDAFASPRPFASWMIVGPEVKAFRDELAVEPGGRPEDRALMAELADLVRLTFDGVTTVDVVDGAVELTGHVTHLGARDPLPARIYRTAWAIDRMGDHAGARADFEHLAKSAPESWAGIRARLETGAPARGPSWLSLLFDTLAVRPSSRPLGGPIGVVPQLRPIQAAP